MFYTEAKRHPGIQSREAFIKDMMALTQSKIKEPLRTSLAIVKILEIN